MKDIDFLISFLKKFYSNSEDKFCNKIEEFHNKVKPISKKITKYGDLCEYRHDGVFYFLIFEETKFLGFCSFIVDEKNKLIKGDLIKVNSLSESIGIGSFLVSIWINFGKKLKYEKIVAEPDSTYNSKDFFKKLGWKVNSSQVELKL